MIFKNLIYKYNHVKMSPESIQSAKPVSLIACFIIKKMFCNHNWVLLTSYQNMKSILIISDIYSIDTE